MSMEIELISLEKTSSVREISRMKLTKKFQDKLEQKEIMDEEENIIHKVEAGAHTIRIEKEKESHQCGPIASNSKGTTRVLKASEPIVETKDHSHKPDCSKDKTITIKNNKVRTQQSLFKI